ncbi:MAG TPA: ribonuclease activity regulator RraA [Alphaproteobacteria bacterium]|nr:ribonuclease activity regulator RraA [Alphaproteobacteria bacterium]
MAHPLSAETRAKLGAVGLSTLTTCLYRRGYRNVLLRGVIPVARDTPRMVGPAYTLRFIPAREDLEGKAGGGLGLHQRAFEECPPESVLVLATGEETEACCCGNLLIGRLKARGVAGVVTDGGYRDVTEVAALGFPAYHVRPAPAPSFLRLHAAALDEPVGCAKVAIFPGDVIVGDAEGVVAIPASLAVEVAEEAVRLARYDGFAAERIAQGRSLAGLYPPGESARAEFEDWDRAKRK